MMDTSESSTPTPNTPLPAVQQQPTNVSKVPLLGEGFKETTSRQLSRSAGSDSSDVDAEGGEETAGSAKAGKRRLFGFGKKRKDMEKSNETKDSESPPNGTAASADVPIAQPVAQRVHPATPISPSRANHPYRSPSSPQRNLYSSSPRIVSPAGSQIFERDVQETALQVPASPAIPSHIQTENHIPPVLDASSEAITNNTLNPDTVEIVMHSSHQPAAVTVTGVGGTEASPGVWMEDLGAHPDKDDTASNYGTLDSADVRRLSFISFSDIVQSEHIDHASSRDSIYVAGLSSLSSGHNRSPSPIRSPISSPGVGTSPPTSKSASVKGIDVSPRAKPLGSPTPSFPSPGGELTIETMRQALRRTESGDLSGIRSQPLSPSSPDGLSDRSFK